MNYQNPFGTTGTDVPYVNGNPATGQEGSIIPALAVQEPQQEIVNAITAKGLTPTDADLTQLAQAAGYWIGMFGGTANALGATLSPLPASINPGLTITGLAGSSAPNTGPVTLNIGIGGTIAVTKSDGTPLTGGEIASGGLASFVYTGTSFVLFTSVPGIFVRIVPQTTFFVNNSTGNSTGDTTGNGLTAGTAWFSIGHAVTQLQPYNLGGQTITLQLANTGINYAGPLAFTAPSSGTLIVNGDPSNQSSYSVTGNSPANTGLVTITGTGQVTLSGLTIENTAGQGTDLCVENGAVVSCSNVTLGTSIVGSVALALASVGGQINWGPGNIMGGDANHMWLGQINGSMIMEANISTASTPSFPNGTVSFIAGAQFAVAQAGLFFTGSGATGPRYSVTTNAVVNTNGAGSNFFPGNSAGSTDGYGVYV